MWRSPRRRGPCGHGGPRRVVAEPPARGRVRRPRPPEVGRNERRVRLEDGGCPAATDPTKRSRVFRTSASTLVVPPHPPCAAPTPPKGSQINISRDSPRRRGARATDQANPRRRGGPTRPEPSTRQNVGHSITFYGRRCAETAGFREKSSLRHAERSKAPEKSSNRPPGAGTPVVPRPWRLAARVSRILTARPVCLQDIALKHDIIFIEQREDRLKSAPSGEQVRSRRGED